MPTYLVPIDLQQNELRNARIQNLAVAPGTPVAGQVYFNTTDHKLYTYDGTVWQAGSGATGTAGGDLTGTYPNPTVAALAIDNSKISATAAIALSKLATDPLARANHTGTQLAATISDFDTEVHTARLDQLAIPTAAVSLNGQALTNVLNPVGPQDAATKAYVDATAQGLDVKASVRAASTGDLTLSGTQTVDGVALLAGDRVLVKAQATASDNGIYVVAAGAWTRSADADANAKVTSGLYTFIEQGTVNADAGWVLTTDGAIVVGTTNLTFVQFTGLGQISAGAGLTKTGNQLDVVGTAGRITANADTLDIDATYVGQTSITTLGAVTTGTWTGTTIAIANGGTGATTAFNARTALGGVGTYTVLNGGTDTDVLTHGLATLNVSVTVRLVSNGLLLNVDVYVTDAGTVTVMYGAAQTAGTLAITVIG